jgi:hypothetical protein
MTADQATPAKPAEGSYWRHHSDRVYRVLFIANDTDDPRPGYRPTVVYEGVGNGKKWAGPLSDWHRRMRPYKAEGKAE